MVEEESEDYRKEPHSRIAITRMYLLTLKWHKYSENSLRVSVITFVNTFVRKQVITVLITWKNFPYDIISDSKRPLATGFQVSRDRGPANF